MKAQELRIGNWLGDLGNIPRQIDAETLYNIAQIEAQGGVVIDANPVPLTPEWLEKFGFTHNAPDYWTYEDKVNGLCEFRFGLSDVGLHCSVGDDKTGIFYNIITHVHQLQNLYFALTGEELTIKQ